MREKPYLPAVAIITDSLDAQWAEPFAFTMDPGTYLWPEPMKLTEGYVEITFNDGAEVILQSPVEFTLESARQIFLKSGILTAKVPHEAVGFVVRTNGAVIVDYGTEFGVVAHTSGETEAHIFQGEVDLRVGTDAVVFSESKRLKAGYSGRVNKSGKLSAKNIKAKPNRFVREMPGKKSYGQPGHRLDLSDIAGGGNGFGTSSRKMVIDPATGQFIQHTDRYSPQRFASGERFNPVTALDFVDGVFIPDTGYGPTIISTAGDIFEECPDTNGTVRKDIITYDKVYQTEGSNLNIRGEIYGTPDKPAISMHSNMGITFDLEAIRRAMPGTDILRFEAVCAICQTPAVGADKAKTDFSVLVDGKLRFRRTGMTFRSTALVDIVFHSYDQFLTLVTTDGGDGNIYDRCLFAEPVLVLGAKD